VARDEELMNAYVRGDEAAFDELFRRYAPLLTRIMRRRLATESDAQDLVQQAFLQLHRARGDFRVGMPFRPWLFTIAFNLQREAYRKLRTRPGDRPSAAGDDDPASEPADLASQRDVRMALSSLPAETREVIALHWLDGLSFPEVAALVGASLSAVKIRAHRGYGLIRRYIDASS
jgi:RNA polymerase sigma factor (sigma-70 family)